MSWDIVLTTIFSKQFQEVFISHHLSVYVLCSNASLLLPLLILDESVPLIAPNSEVARKKHKRLDYIQINMNSEENQLNSVNLVINENSQYFDGYSMVLFDDCCCWICTFFALINYFFVRKRNTHNKSLR